MSVTALVAALAMLAGCGSTTSATSPSSSTSGSSAVSVHPGCGTYCQQAGEPAGEAPPGYPCPRSGCLNCPPNHCVSLLSNTASAKGRAFTVTLRCNLTRPCRGAFLLCFPALCNPGPTRSGGGGRLAASDFKLGPGQTADVAVGLTTLGEQVASLPAGFRAGVLIDLLDYGIVTVVPAPGFRDPNSLSGAALHLKTADAGFTPPGGAIASCGETLFVGPNTSCRFADAVQRAYEGSSGNSPNVVVRAASPVTRQTYTMHCTGDSPHVCTGGRGARVIWY